MCCGVTVAEVESVPDCDSGRCEFDPRQSPHNVFNKLYGINSVWIECLATNQKVARSNRAFRANFDGK